MNPKENTKNRKPSTENAGNADKKGSEAAGALFGGKGAALFGGNTDNAADKTANPVASLFSGQQTVVKVDVEREPLLPDTDENKPNADPKLSLAQIKERENRTVFVGNVNINCKHKTLKNFFQKHGKVDNVWFRSVPVNNESKVPIKGKVATKDFIEDADAMNAYVLFAELDDAKKAVEAENNKEFLGKYLRVTLANQKTLDTKTTIFVGNLYYKATEDQLRDFFKDCGEIESVRMIRDPITHLGKGFAYIRFRDKASYVRGLDKNLAVFMQRELRVKKAVEMEEEKKKRDVAFEQKRDKDRVLLPKARHNDNAMKEERINNKADKAENLEIMKDFSSRQVLEDSMTAERADEIFKTKGKLPSHMLKTQFKKIKKQGVGGV